MERIEQGIEIEEIYTHLDYIYFLRKQSLVADQKKGGLVHVLRDGHVEMWCVLCGCNNLLHVSSHILIRTKPIVLVRRDLDYLSALVGWISCTHFALG